MEVRFDDKVALVTGASRGIGLAIAAEFLASGAAGVVITGRKPEGLDEAAAELGKPERVLPLRGNADDPDHPAGAVAEAVARFGRLDILVNNAGTNPAAGMLADVDLGAVDKTWAVNQRGPLLFARAAWQGWMRRHGGAIINVASVAGLQPAPFLGAYNVSKAALIHMTRQLAMEMAPDVRVNAVAPGIVKTRLSRALWDGRESTAGSGHPLRRIGEPADVAGVVAFLASDRASWITGVVVPVDGGLLGATPAPGFA